MNDLDSHHMRPCQAYRGSVSFQTDFTHHRLTFKSVLTCHYFVNRSFSLNCQSRRSEVVSDMLCLPSLSCCLFFFSVLWLHLRFLLDFCRNAETWSGQRPTSGGRSIDAYRCCWRKTTELKSCWVFSLLIFGFHSPEFSWFPDIQTYETFRSMSVKEILSFPYSCLNNIVK